MAITFFHLYNSVLTYKLIFFHDIKTKEFISGSANSLKKYQCIQLFTYDAAILYLLRKISYTKYYFVWSIGTIDLPNDLIKKLKNVEIIIANNHNKIPSPKNNLILVNNYINKNYEKVLEIEIKLY